MSAPTPPAQRNLVWDWSRAFMGAVYTLPAAVVMWNDVSKGLALGFGVLPAAIIGIVPRRRDRVRVVIFGALMGIPIAVGSLLANAPVVAVLAIFVLAVGAAMLSTRRAIGTIVMTLSLPMVGVGLSYSDKAEGAGLALLIVAGSAFAWIVSLLWPEQPAPPARHAPPPSPTVMLGYGIRLGLAGATAAAIGFALDLDHVGWATAAALLVMRPAVEMQQLRSVGRVASVAIGATTAGALAWATSAPGWYSVAIIVVIAGAAATFKSRWYVTPAFTTFLALSLLVYANPATAGERFNERVLETLLGVALAFLFGLVVPEVSRLLRPE